MLPKSPKKMSLTGMPRMMGSTGTLKGTLSGEECRCSSTTFKALESSSYVKTVVVVCGGGWWVVGRWVIKKIRKKTKLQIVQNKI